MIQIPYKKYFDIIAAIVIVVLGHAFATGQNDITKKIDAILNTSSVAGKIQLGLAVDNALTTKKVYGFNENKNFMPASVLKLLYTLSAVDTKGDSYRFKTKFMYSGSILPDGSLQGDLIIVAGGDPTLASKRFFQNGINDFFKIITAKLNEKGIKCIDGDIILVLSDYHYPVHGSWQYQDLGNYYAAGTYPLNFMDNEYSVKFALGKKAGDKTKISKISPDGLDFLNITNHVVTGKSGTGDNAYLYGIPYSVDIEAKGTLASPKGFYTIKGSLPNPPAVFLRLLADFMERENMYFEDLLITQENIKGAKALFTLSSPPLLDISEMCNNYSINMYSEALASLLCLTGNKPDLYLDEDEIKSFFQRYNIDFDKTQIVDGCGLSTENLISPSQINDFLILMIKRMGLNKVLRIIPQAGIEGYAKSLFDRRDNVYIKSGSISGVLNYSGIVKSPSGKYYTFSLMSNNVLEKDRKKVKALLIKIIKVLSKT